MLAASAVIAVSRCLCLCRLDRSVCQCLSQVQVYQTDQASFRHGQTRRYGVPADAISVPADSAAAVVKFTISIPRESFTNAKAKYRLVVV